MGNENSKLKGLIVDKNAVEANDFFVLYNASMADNSKTATNKTQNTTTNMSNEEGRLEKLSIFQGVHGTYSSWAGQGPMKHGIRNFMIYRHPYILKYITTWEESGEIHLGTERVRPLNSVLSTLSDIQICLGLRTILCALIFLTETALARHLNICPSSIYVTENGSWRLAGFEFVWKSNEIKKEIIELLSQYRHKPAVDPEELKNDDNLNSIEQFAFANFCEEILGKKAKAKNSTHISDCETPHVSEFREYCRTVLQHKKPEMRPKLSAILLHPYFNHEFILIHSFLFELPLKNIPEKQAFFTSLVDRLRGFNENVVATQLSADLLSRMVLLDPTAQLCVTPYVLKTKSIENASPLFSRDTYARHVMPHIRRMFRLRDAQIRLILLEYFMEYVCLLTEQELKEFILPHLLDGMNDTNDLLVAKTLRCLADLISILGASTVLGERMRLFSDGRPQATIAAEAARHWVEPRSITPVLTGHDSNSGLAISVSDDEEVGYRISGSPLPDNIGLSGSSNSLASSELINRHQDSLLEMPPRLSPDGGEDEKSVVLTDLVASTTVEIIEPANAISCGFNSNLPNYDESTSMSKEENFKTIDLDVNEDEAWSDWETDQIETSNPSNSNNDLLNFNAGKGEPRQTTSKRLQPKQTLDDLSSLDIQIQKMHTKSNGKSDEFDFFKDMEPVIQSDTHLNMLDEKTRNPLDEEKDVLIDTNRFAALQPDICDLNSDELHNIDNGWDVEDENVDDTSCLQTSND